MALPQCYNFQAYDMATKFGWVNGKPGMGAVEPVSTGLGTLSSGLGEARDRSAGGIQELEVAWRGPASDSARESLTATAQNIEGTATVTENASARLTDYGHSFEAMRRQISYVNPDDYGWWQKAGDWSSELWHTLRGNGTDHVTIAERNQANDEVANRALQAHSVETSALDDRFGTATAPPPPAAPTPGPGGGGGNAPVGGIPSAPGPVAGPETVGAANLGAPPSPGPGAVPPPVPAPGAPGGPGPPGGPPQPGPAPAAVPAGPVGPAAPAGPGAAGSQRGGGGGGSTGAAAAPGTPQRPSPGGGGVPVGPGAAGVPGDRSRGGPGSPVPYRNGGRIPGPGAVGSGVRDRGTDFSSRLRDQPPFSRPIPTYPPGSGPGAGRGPGSVLGSGRGFTGGPLGLGSGASPDPPYGGRGSSSGGPGAGGAWGTESRTTGGRGATTAESWSAARPVERGIGAGGYGPMMGGAGGLQDAQEHRNRYVVPTDEVFDVRVDATDAVLGPEEDDRR